MRVILHIVTALSPPSRVEVTVVDLAAGEPDYAKLLEEIFAADLVAVW